MSNAIFQSVKARQHQYASATKSQQGIYRHPSARGYAAPICKDARLGLSSAGSLLVDSEVDEKKMCAKFIVSTVSPDRVFDEVPPESCIPLLHNYRRNPVIFFDHHEEYTFPIATCESPDGEFCFWPEKDLGRITSMAWFHGKTPESNIIFGLVAAKVLRTASLGFLPIEGKRLQSAGGRESFRFSLIDVVEWSVVGVPMNSQAIAIGLSKGMMYGEKVTPILRKALSSYTDPMSGAVRSGYDPKGNTVNLQSIVFAKTVFDQTKAIEITKSYSLDHSDFEERDDSLVFHQKPTTLCDGLETLEEFIAKSETGDVSWKSNGIQFVTYKTLKEMGGEQIVTNAVSASPPAGAAFMHKLVEMAEEAIDVMGQHTGKSERPAIHEFHTKGMEELVGHHKGLHDFIGSNYPDHPAPAKKNLDIAVVTKQYIDLILKGLSSNEGSVAEPKEDFTVKPGVSLLMSAVGCIDKAHQFFENGCKSIDHPGVEEIGKACMKELPARRKAVEKLMKSEYKDAHEQLGWGKKEEDSNEPAGAASKPKAEDKDKKKEEKKDAAKTKSLKVDGTQEEEVKTPKVEADKDTMIAVNMTVLKNFLSDTINNCNDLARNMGLQLETSATGDGKNPYENRPTVSKSLEIEPEMDAITVQLLQELIDGVKQIQVNDNAMARQFSFMTGGKG